LSRLHQSVNLRLIYNESQAVSSPKRERRNGPDPAETKTPAWTDVQAGAKNYKFTSSLRAAKPAHGKQHPETANHHRPSSRLGNSHSAKFRNQTRFDRADLSGSKHSAIDV
jgi:hypothetical protein